MFISTILASCMNYQFLNTANHSFDVYISCDLKSSCKSPELSYRWDCHSLIGRSGICKFPFSAEAMPSTTEIGL